MAEITVGDEAIDRLSNFSPAANYTAISGKTAATGTGIITSVELWANQNMTALRIGIFYLISGTTYKCRSSAAVGDVTACSKVTITQDTGSSPLSLAIVTGDFIGWLHEGGSFEATAGQPSGSVYYLSSEAIDPGDQAEYTAHTSLVSLKGIGATTGGWSGGDIGEVPIADIADIAETALADILKVDGVA